MTPSNVRIAALLALRDNLGICATTILMVPAVSIVHRVFDATWYVNWRLMLTISGILTALFFAFFFLAPAHRIMGAELLYRIGLSSQLIASLCTVFLARLACRVLQQRSTIRLKHS